MKKISNKYIRLEKIEKLKIRVLSDIDYILDYYLKVCHENIARDYFEDIVNICFALIRLREYFNKDNLFMGVNFVDENNDNIVYIVKENDIDIWLDDNFNFVHNFLSTMNKDFLMLNEEFFAYEFTSIIDRILYKEKI